MQTLRPMTIRKIAEVPSHILLFRKSNEKSKLKNNDHQLNQLDQHLPYKPLPDGTTREENPSKDNKWVPSENVRDAQQTSYAKSHYNTYTRILAYKKSLWLLHYVKYEKETNHFPDIWTHSLSEVSYTLQNTLFYPLPSDPINTQCKFTAMD